MSEIFEEATMQQTLNPYIPNRETLLAGIHALVKESSVTAVFGPCVRTESGLLPEETGGIVAVTKKKFSTADIYFGVTQSTFVITTCEKSAYYYQFDDVPNAGTAEIQPLDAPLSYDDIGCSFPLSDIQRCVCKKGWMGSVKCTITLKNGSYFKLVFPKLGGLGGGMPRHAEYRAAILARLGGKLD